MEPKPTRPTPALPDVPFVNEMRLNWRLWLAIIAMVFLFMVMKAIKSHYSRVATELDARGHDEHRQPQGRQHPRFHLGLSHQACTLPQYDSTKRQEYRMICWLYNGKQNIWRKSCKIA